MGIHPEYLYLQSLGSKLTGLVWIEYLIRKLWDALRGTWNHRNHNLHTTEGKVKMALLENINNRVRFNLRRGMFRLPSRCQFIFNTNLHSLLSRPVHQRLSLISAVSITRLCYRWKCLNWSPKRTPTRFSYPTSLTVSWSHHSQKQIINLCSVPTSSSTGPRLLRIEQEGEIDKTQHPDHDDQINNIWNHSKISHIMAASTT